MKENIDTILQTNTRMLARISPEEQRLAPPGNAPLPQVEALHRMMDLIKAIIFPRFFGPHSGNGHVRTCHIGVAIQQLYELLTEQAERALNFCGPEKGCRECEAEQTTLDFIGKLPELKRLLLTDVEAIFKTDPAARNYGEVVYCYPAVTAMTHYRTAHALHLAGLPVLPRILTEAAHAATGIDIHPGAEIGEYFSIDHGTGVVIGETCIIGNHVTLYQGVTLGARNFTLDADGNPINLPRHPILEDRVTVYSNSTILGRVTIGHDTVIGGNIWLTGSVEPFSRILQTTPVSLNNGKKKSAAPEPPYKND